MEGCGGQAQTERRAAETRAERRPDQTRPGVGAWCRPSAAQHSQRPRRLLQSCHAGAQINISRQGDEAIDEQLVMAAQGGAGHGDASWVAMLDLERATGPDRTWRGNGKEMGRSFASSCGLLLPCSLHFGCSKQMDERRDACATAATMMAHGGSQETRAAIDFCLATCAFLRVWMQRGNRRWLEAARLDSTVVETLFFQFLVRESSAKLRAGRSAV